MVLWPGSSGIKNFQSRDFRDGILHNPRIPGLFGTGLAWNFYPRISSKKYGYGQISQTICLQMENFVVAILYLAYLALKYMYFEDLWIKVADFRKWGRYVRTLYSPHYWKFVNMVWTLCAERGRRHVVLILEIRENYVLLIFGYLWKPRKMDLFCGLKMCLGGIFLFPDPVIR